MRRRELSPSPAPRWPYKTCWIFGFVAIRTGSFCGAFGSYADNLTAYDALYVALAEALDATLLTCDGKLALAPGHHARVEVI